MTTLDGGNSSRPHVFEEVLNSYIEIMPGQTHSYRFFLRLSRDEIARYYQGRARDISVKTENGQQLRFAARHLRPFLSSTGIQGRFLLTTDDRHRFHSLKKID